MFKNLLKLALFFSILLFLECHSIAQKFEIKLGDLLFLDMDCGEFCDAVEKVTFGVNGAKFSHIGLVSVQENGEKLVLEAVSKGVIATPLDTFLSRSKDANGKPKVVVGRLKEQYNFLITNALNEAKKLLGKPYDDVFDLQNDAYYCSELVYEAFKRANAGTPLFEPQPMTFKDPDTKENFEIWVKYYKNLGKPIPEGQLGLNPGGISRSSKIDIVHCFGRPTGWQGDLLD